MNEFGKAIILIADDDSGARETGRQVVEGMVGARTIMASNGKEALRKAREEKPDLILLDMALPKMDGLEVARRLKSKHDTKDIPIIVLSGLSVAPARALELGCEGYLRKPYEISALIQEVRRLLARVPQET